VRTRAVRTFPAAVALALALAPVMPVAARAGAEPVLRFRGPRPERVWSMTGPARVVLDFPAGTSGAVAAEGGPGPAALQVRRSEFRDLDGVHPRIVVVLAGPAPFWVSWKDSQGALNLASQPARQPALSVATAARTAVRPSAPGSPHPGASRPAAPSAARAAASKGPGRAALHAPTRNPRPAVRQALARRDAAVAAALLDSCAAGIPADTAAVLFERLALLEAGLRAAPARVEAHARRALQLGAESVGLDLCLGRALDRTGRSEEAARWFRRATQITADPEAADPDRRAAFFLWADALYRHGDSEESLGAYAEAMHAYPAAPECPWALHQSVKLAQRLGRTQEAAQLLRQLQERHPADYWTAQARARMAPAAAPRSAAR
jgi:hypothetical protein